MHRQGAAVVILAAAACAVACASIATTPQSSVSPTGGADSVQTMHIQELGGRSIMVEPFADFLMSSGDLVWVSGVAPALWRTTQTWNR